jgi:hypothetical protein
MQLMNTINIPDFPSAVIAVCERFEADIVVRVVRVTDYIANQRYVEMYVELDGEDLSPHDTFENALRSCEGYDPERIGVTSSQPYFQSASWEDIEAVDRFVEATKGRYPDARIFYLRGD